MGHGHRTQQHQATDGLMNLFLKANRDLSLVQFRLEKEFQQVYSDNVNPMKLVSRLKKTQEELSTLKEQCRQLLSAKQDVIDEAQKVLFENKKLLQRLQASMGISPTRDSDDPAFANFKEIIDEWTIQVRSRLRDEQHEDDATDINKLLFSAIVEIDANSKELYM